MQNAREERGLNMVRKQKLMIINGPNLNLLGTREPDVYGNGTLEDLQELLTLKYGQQIDLDFFQTNIEGEIINAIQKCQSLEIVGIIINPGAYTHYSIAIHDALKSVSIPAIEVHISNIHNREEYRKTSVIAPATLGQISGFGFKSYALAVEYFLMI